MKTIQFAPDEFVPDIRQDEVFKAVLTKDTFYARKTRDLFLSAFIGAPLRVITICTNEPPLNDLRDRKIRYDINFRFNNGQRANLEMTKDPDPFEALRMEYYLARLHTGQEIKGTDRSYHDLKISWHFSILGSRSLFADKALIHRFEYYDKENNTVFGGRTRIITLELEKVRHIAGKTAQEMSGAERWAVFLRHSTDKAQRALINEILQIEEGIEMAGRTMRGFTQSELELFRSISEEKAILDTRSWVWHGKQKAKAEGLAEGKAVGLAEGLAEGYAKGLAEKERAVAKANAKALAEKERAQNEARAEMYRQFEEMLKAGKSLKEVMKNLKALETEKG